MNLSLENIDRVSFAGGAGLAALSALATDTLVGDPFVGMVVALAFVTAASWAQKVKEEYGIKGA